MHPRIIAIDMDGTLLHSDGHISPRNRAALRLAETSGAEVVIATGRRHCYAMRVLRDLELSPTNALVSSNGTVIRTIGSELIHRSHMAIEDALWLCDHLTDFRNTLVITFDKVDENGEDSRGALACEHLDDLHASIGRWMRSNAPYIQHVERLEDALTPANGNAAPIQMMLCGAVDRMAQAETRLLEHPLISAVGEDIRHDTRIALNRTIYPDRDLSIVDILPAGSSKASALQLLARLRGISTDEILAIGDNWNDLPMLLLAGRSVLMGNAPDDLKALAQKHGWTIAASNDEDGVALTIESALEGALI
jgi:hydroxymethylpyrimidine pyrophosphatase-like HAD family hydrolase